jgi:hypothetical protein
MPITPAINMPPLSITLVVNMPPLSITPVVHMPPLSITPAVNFPPVSITPAVDSDNSIRSCTLNWIYSPNQSKKCKMPPICVLTKYEKTLCSNIFSTCHWCHWRYLCNLELRMSSRIFETIRDGAGGRKIRGWREHDAWKNQKQKISWNGPFNSKFWRSAFLCSVCLSSFLLYTYKGKPFPHPFKRRKKNSHKLLNSVLEESIIILTNISVF